jgi:hypothetical protein
VFRSSVFVALVFLAAPALRANVINSVTDTSSATTWSTPAVWSNNAAPAAGNDYVSSNVLRTTSGEFAGDSLTLNAGGVLATKQSSQSESNLTLNTGSSIQNFHADNGTDTVGGNVTAHGAVSITATGINRSLTLSASITGDATFTQNVTGALTLSSAGNSGFTGSWVITNGALKATAANSLGTFTSLTMNGGTLNADYDVNDPTGSLTITGGVMTLDQNFTLGSLTINGNVLAPGSYSFNDLNTAYDAFFADGGTGSITVGAPTPEPTSLAFLALSAIIPLRRRRR